MASDDSNDYKSAKRKVDSFCNSKQINSCVEAVYAETDEYTTVQLASFLDSDAEELNIKLGKRKRRLPARYLDGNNDHPSGSLMQIRNDPGSSDEEAASTSKISAKQKQPPCVTSPKLEKDIKEIKTLVGQTFKALERAVLKINTLEKKVDLLQAEIAEIKPSITESKPLIIESKPVVIEKVLEKAKKLQHGDWKGPFHADLCYGETIVPEDISLPEINLPFKSDKELTDFNLQLESNQELQIKLTRHLHMRCVGNSLSSYLKCIMKKLLSKDVAMQYSRIGRSGKKSFVDLTALYRTILATVLMRYEDVTVDDIDKKLSKELAQSSDWEGRHRNQLKTE